MSIEKKYTREEIKTIVDGELRKANLNPVRELNMNEMESVSGGLDTHDQIDAKWNVVSNVLNVYGREVALITAQELGIRPGGNGSGPNPFFDGQNGIERCRKHCHDLLNAYQSSGNKYAEKWNTSY